MALCLALWRLEGMQRQGWQKGFGCWDKQFGEELMRHQFQGVEVSVCSAQFSDGLTLNDG